MNKSFKSKTTIDIFIVTILVYISIVITAH
jgi:hypothetical protein